MLKSCSHEDSKLKCAECEMPICGRCMVECPVGIRCKKCVSPQNGKVSDSNWFTVAKAFGATALVGMAAGWIMSLVNIPYISCLVAFFLGIYGGRWVTQFLDRRLGSKTGVTVVFGALFGIALSPVLFVPYLIVEVMSQAFTGHGPGIFDCLLEVLSILFNPVCFFAGLLRPTLWGDFR